MLPHHQSGNGRIQNGNQENHDDKFTNAHHRCDIEYQCTDANAQRQSNTQTQRDICPAVIHRCLQESPGKGAAKNADQTNGERHRNLLQPGGFGPDELVTKATGRKLQKGKSRDIADVSQIIGIADTEPQKEVVQKHHQHHAVIQTQSVLLGTALFYKGIDFPQADGNLQ